MTCGSLFAGIGGFDLGFERAGIKTIWQVEINEYCRRVLARHFPDAERFSDIRDCGAHNLKPVDVICGGFPCQDISLQGVNWGIRTGLEGNRSGLWWEMLRIIRVVRPQFVIVENVAAILDNGLGDLLGSLAESGYDAEWDCLPASAFGADHQRDRFFLVAYSACQRRQGRKFYQWPSERVEALPKSELWGNLPSPYVCRGNDGVSHRMERLRALGNAVVPQVAEWIGRRIVEATA